MVLRGKLHASHWAFVAVSEGGSVDGMCTSSLQSIALPKMKGYRNCIIELSSHQWYVVSSDLRP